MNITDLLNDPGTGESPPVLTATEAREGVTGHNVRYVLIGGLAAVVVAFILGYMAVHAFFA
jgi:hypothetical protein